MGLKTYRSRRNFRKTPEPSTATARQKDSLIFVVHKHAARALHYDLRLELGGVLKSWAVPKGPSLDPSVKRLAVMVEDHPFEYKDFEGTIPKGNYGAGNVIIWDKGTYHHPAAGDRRESIRLLREGLAKGDLKFVLEGEKLTGEFALVATKKDNKSWLLLKKKDRTAGSMDVLSETRSVVSGRTVEDISVTRIPDTARDVDLSDAPLRSMPHAVRPMLAARAREPFDHPDWLFEVKWDGYRALAEVRKDAVSLYSRNLIPFNKKFPQIVSALGHFSDEALLDGEIVVVDDQGRPDFGMLQDYGKSGPGHLLYYVFDLLHFRGRDLTGLPLQKRRQILKQVLPSAPELKFSDHIANDGILFFSVARKKGLEGIMAKEAGSTYSIGVRSRRWLKITARLTQDCVIAGFTRPGGRRKHFGSLVLGVFEGNTLVYIGHSGGGFTQKMLGDIRAKMEPLIQSKCPFKAMPDPGEEITWVKPKLVCEVTFHGWTAEGILRKPSFLRLREDKNPREAMREKPESAE